MKTTGRVSRQLTDLLAYVLLPGSALITTSSFSRRILRRASAWNWFMAAAAESALNGARNHLDIPNEKEWKQRWKQVELLDARDLYMMLFGRTRSVMAEIECPADFELARNRVMVGMHWGPAISILKLLAVSGLGPAFVHRPSEHHLLFYRPFYYLFSRLVGVYLSRTLADRAVPVGGARGVLQGMLDEPGSICILMDAPPKQGRPSVNRPVLGGDARFNVGFPTLFANSHQEYVLYAMKLKADGSVRKQLELLGPFSADSAEEFLDNYAAFLDRHLSTDSAQWRIWHAGHEFWIDSARTDDPAAAG